MKTLLTFSLTVLTASLSWAAPASTSSADVACRAKAKEIALQTYSSCVTDARQAKVDEIRVGYEKDLAALKSKYDKEIKKLTAKNASMKTKKQVAAVKAKAPAKNAKKLVVDFSAEPVSAPVPVAGIAKTLPKKDLSPLEAAPVQSVSEGTKVVVVEPQIKGSSEPAPMADLEAEALAYDGDQIEYNEAPQEQTQSNIDFPSGRD